MSALSLARAPSSADAEPGDAELLRHVAAGEMSALGLLYDRYDHDVRRVIARLGVPAGDVDDLVQSTFLATLRLARAYDGRPCARPWLLGVAVQMARGHRRSVARLAARLAAWAREPFTSVRTPEELTGASEAAARAQRALRSLAPKKREVFVLVVLEDLSGEEAARALAIPAGTVATRLHHARKELRALLQLGEHAEEEAGR